MTVGKERDQQTLDHGFLANDRCIHGFSYFQYGFAGIHLELLSPWI